MRREEVLKGVLRNYARFYAHKAFFEYPFIPDPFKRRYMLGCLKAFMKTTATKRFYDLGRLRQRGLHTEVDFGFDESKILTRQEIIELQERRPDLKADVNFAGTVLACGGPREHTDAHLAEETVVNGD
jgi:anaerobic magnesium-protoporphyrin IX monomethyl ester cyclase